MGYRWTAAVLTRPIYAELIHPISPAAGPAQIARRRESHAAFLARKAVAYRVLKAHRNEQIMKVAERIETEPLESEIENLIQMPFGLLGFEQVKKYRLLASPEEAPFLWLQTDEDATIAFLVVSPFLVLPAYQPDIPDEDAEFLGLQKPDDALIFNIVTLRENGGTVNLKGPIIVNRHTRVGKQVIPTNATKFALQHPLPVMAAACP